MERPWVFFDRQMDGFVIVIHGVMVFRCLFVFEALCPILLIRLPYLFVLNHAAIASDGWTDESDLAAFDRWCVGWGWS